MSKAVNKEKYIDFSKYDVYRDGKIFSKAFNKNRFLNTNKRKDSYSIVTLKSTDGKRRTFLLHRVIWYYFNGEIPENMQVNHIDEDKSNNALSNLNLLTLKENINWGTRNERAAKTLSVQRKGKMLGKDNPNWGHYWTDEQKEHLSELTKGRYLNEKSVLAKKVHQFTLEGELVKIWPSTMECKRNGFNQGLVAECCRGGRWRNGKWMKSKTYKGFIWKYVLQ